MPDQFWDLMHSEFIVMLIGYRRKLIQAFNDRLSQAWYTEAFARYKRLPSLKSLTLDPDKGAEPKKKQSTEDMMEMAKSLTLAFGGTIEKV